MHPFEYFAPNTLDEAIALLRREDSQTNIIAGGTDLIVEIKEQIRRPDCLVDINKIDELDGLHYDDTAGLRIGALTTVRQVEQAAVVQNKYPGLFQAVSQLGSIQIRNRATVVGNICRASPSADTPPPLIAAGATITIHGFAGERTMQLEAFFTGPGQTVLGPGDILTAINLPPPPPHTGRVYLKLGRRKAMELATVGVAVSIKAENQICREVRIVLGAVAPTPIRATKAEAVLEGVTLNPALIALAARTAMSEARPISDVRSSADYRRTMVAVYTEQAIGEAWHKAVAIH